MFLMYRYFDAILCAILLSGGLDSQGFVSVLMRYMPFLSLSNSLPSPWYLSLDPPTWVPSEAHHPPFGNEHDHGFRTRTLEIVRSHSQANDWMARGAAMDRHQVVEFALSALEPKTRNL